MTSRRLAVIGIDGFSPVWMDRFIREGELPAIGAIASEGVTVRLRSTLPATTPVAWPTVATGCSPAVTGIEGNLIHRPGNRLDQRLGCYAHRCQAEPLWETVKAAGRRSFVVKFPVSYPSTTATFRLDGAAGWAGMKCLHELSSASVASLAEDDGRLLPSDGAWRGAEEKPEPLVWRGTWSLKTLWGGPPFELHVSVTRSPEGDMAVSIAEAPAWDRILSRLAPGEWSVPLTVRAQGRRSEGDYSFRVKVLECAGEPLRLRLLNTVLHERTGHSAPAEIWQSHIERVGPIEEQTDPSLFFARGIDLDTQLELFRLNAEWLKRISVSLLSAETWDLYMTQVHFTDWAHHMLEGALDPRHPEFDPDSAGKYEHVLLESYRMADAVVAEIRAVAGPETDVMVLGDHGQDLHHTTFHANEWLAAEGLLHWQGDGVEVDWSRTQVYAAGNFLYLNLEGREPTGIVPPRRARELKARLIDGLLSLEDPSRGARPILIADEKEGFEPMGAHGIGAGDVIFVCRSGYQARNNRGPLFVPTRLFREFTSGHDHFWPFDPKIQTRMFAAGPSFKRGYQHPRSEDLIDVAPTACTVLGVNPSPQCEGRPLLALLRSSTPASVTEPTAETAVGD